VNLNYLYGRIRMRKYKNVEKIVEELEIVKCDICGTEYNYPEKSMEIQEFLNIDFHGGYASVFGDGCHVEGNICQRCVKALLGKYLRLDGLSPNIEKNQGSAF